MKRNLFAVALISAMFAGAASSAFASDAYPDGSQFAWVPQTGTVSRAQVEADLAKAQAQGLLAQNDYDYPKLADQGPGKTRAEVKAELADAAAHGLLAQSDAFYPQAGANAPASAVAQANDKLTIANAADNSPQP